MSGPAGPGLVTAIHFLGEGAILAEVRDQASAHRLAASVVAAHLTGVQDVVPGARTVVIRADPLQADLTGLAADLARWEVGPDATAVARTVEVPVVYDGEDLGEVAAICGLTVEEVVRRHTAPRYTVAFLGFSPGFAYLSGLDPALTAPRRATPRTSVPAGSVAVAETHTAIYPQATPGGWQVLGHTDLVLFDPDADPPTLLRPSDHVRLVAQP